MNSHITVSELNRGGKNIDLMREMIETTLSALDGRIDKLVQSRKISIDEACVTIACGNVDGRWTIHVYPRSNRRRTVMTCTAGHEPIMHARVLFSTINEGFDASGIVFEDVEKVFDSLQTVIDAIMDRFPILKADAEVLRRAAHKFPASV